MVCTGETEARNCAQSSGTEAVVAIARVCRSCGTAFLICTRCWRGQVYCSGECRSSARRRTMAACDKRYRAGDRGKERRRHQERARRQRRRHREIAGGDDCVGYPPSAATCASDTGACPDMSRALSPLPEVTHAESRHFPKSTRSVCARCKANCSHRVTLEDHLASRERARKRTGRRAPRLGRGRPGRAPPR